MGFRSLRPGLGLARVRRRTSLSGFNGRAGAGVCSADASATGAGAGVFDAFEVLGALAAFAVFVFGAAFEPFEAFEGSSKDLSFFGGIVADSTCEVRRLLYAE